MLLFSVTKDNSYVITFFRVKSNEYNRDSYGNFARVDYVYMG